MRIAGNFRWSSSLTLDLLSRGPHTPVFLRKSVEGVEWKGVVKRSWSKERQESAKREEEWFQNGKSGRDGEERWERARFGGIVHGLC
jgi:hypothetical protein